MFSKIILSNKDKAKGLKLPHEMSDDLAYLIGIFTGDGNIGYRERKKEYSLKVVGNPKDEKNLYHIIIGPKFERVFGFMPDIRYYDKNSTYGFRIFSKSLVLFLTKIVGLPLGPKTNIRMPKNLSENDKHTTCFLQGLFDTDGAISFKKRYSDRPYYPVITLSSKSNILIEEVYRHLTKKGLYPVKILNYKLVDPRIKSGYTIINRIEINGVTNFAIFQKQVGFQSPKHNQKIENWSGR